MVSVELSDTCYTDEVREAIASGAADRRSPTTLD